MRLMNLILILIFMAFGTASAGLDEFWGHWTNANSSSDGLAALDIGSRGGDVTVQAWGVCEPEDCQWGEAYADVYGPNSSSDLSDGAIALMTTLIGSPTDKTLIIRPSGEEILVDVFYRFIYGEGQNNFAAQYRMVQGNTPNMITGSPGNSSLS